MVTLGDGVEEHASAVPRDELRMPPIGDDAAVDRVLGRLTAARLVTAERDALLLSHESLIHSWPT